jgi:hypothetical protein
MSTGQQLEQDYWPVACDGCACAVEHLALAALDVGLDETNIHQAELVEGADLDIIGLEVLKLAVRSLQAPGKVEGHSRV